MFFSLACENLDGNCPDCTEYDGNLNFTAVSKIWDPKISKSSLSADLIISEMGEVISYDPPFLSLHISLMYFCCQTREGIFKILKSLETFEWEKLNITFDSFGCNYDSNGKITYLHIMPKLQEPLFDLVQRIENKIILEGGIINHPRKSLFHATLARVPREFPSVELVNKLKDWNFGSFLLDNFWIISPLNFVFRKFSA